MRVSCLMVTLPARWPRAIRAMEAWSRQTHADRELVVVIDSASTEARDAARAAADRIGGHIRIVTSSEPRTLGALRNLAVAQASGEALCIWDDDDLHHPQRIARQLAALIEGGADATVLQDAMLHREAQDTLHWTNWAATPAGGLPGTLMCRAASMPAYPETGPTAQRGEDLDLLQRLRAAGRHILQQAMEPWLYVYVTHGANSSPVEHHAMLARDLSISKGLLLRREAALRKGLRPFAFEGVDVEGSNGRAFSL